MSIYLFQVNNRNTRTRCKICSKLTIKPPEWHNWFYSGVFIFNSEQILYFFFTVIVITFQLVNLHWVEASHTFHIVTIYKKTLYNSICTIRDGILTWRESRRWNFTPGPISYAFGVISISRIVGLYCPQYVIYNFYNMKIFTHVLKLIK